MRQYKYEVSNGSDINAFPGQVAHTVVLRSWDDTDETADAWVRVVNWHVDATAAQQQADTLQKEMDERMQPPRTKNEQERYDLGVQFARDVYVHGKSGIINRGDSHFDAGARDEYARIDECHKHADEYEALAEEQDMIDGEPAKARAQTCRKTAESFRLEAKTGRGHCACCNKPFSVHTRHNHYINTVQDKHADRE